MSSYWDCRQSTTNCIHFLFGDHAAESDRKVLEEFRKARIECFYVDYLYEKHGGEHIANAIAKVLKLPHAPYRLPTSPKQIDVWVPFLDDMITLSQQKDGIVIVVDNAGALLAEDCRTMFKLIEAFLIPFQNWLEQNKPCHLCFQMEYSDIVRTIFSQTSQEVGFSNRG